VFRTVVMRILQSLELIRTKGWSALLRELCYTNREAILLEKDLQDVNEDKDFLKKEDVHFVELTANTIRNYRYASRSRYHKARIYCKKGYQGYAIVREDSIIGDTWYYTSRLSDKPIDIEWLGLKDWSKDHIYTFDIFLVPEERGKYLSSTLQNMAMYSLGKRGFTKAYTYIWADNIPSIWMTRVTNRWKELGRIRMSRFLFFRVGARSK
jgi:hypothetical protein